MFKNILADQWALLSPAVQQHYGITDGEEISMQGELAVKHGTFIKLLMPLIRLTGALVTVEGEKLIVTVDNKRIGDTFYWHSRFNNEYKVYEFKSKMQQFGNDIVEFVGLGIGIRMGISVVNGGVVYEDKGYGFEVGSLLVPITVGSRVGCAHI